VKLSPHHRSLVLLFFLYLAQGLPFGFQAEIAGPLREVGVSVKFISLATLLSLPWMTKALWAPLIDRYGSERLGRRRTFLIPLQLLLVIPLVAASFFPPPGGLFVLVFLILLMNLIAATQDIAVDGLAVDLIPPKALGSANIAQVVGYKCGMLLSGGLLLSQIHRIGWRGWLLGTAALLLLTLPASLLVREPPASAQTAQVRSSIPEVLRTMFRALLRPGAVTLLLFIATYKMGEGMVDVMFKPFLIDRGFKSQQLGAWIGSYGLVASLLGSLFGGFLAYRLPLLVTVGITGTLRSLALIGPYYLSLKPVLAPPLIVSVTIAEHFCGGALTTAMFAFMMSRVDRTIGGTHYTLLACVELAGKFPLRTAAGWIKESLGYSKLFLLGAVLSFLLLLLLIPLGLSERPEGEAAERLAREGDEPAPG
jgi:PAT family beta-lactamase induction signal transducer AmpG